MNINGSSNSNVYGSSSSNGFSGLVSNMDTEALVQKMLSGQQSKIDKQKAIKQTAQWKQNMYRDVITKINSFQTKYFDYGSKTALMSNSFFNQMKSVTSSNAFRVSGSSSAISGDMRVKINQLATTSRVEGGTVKAADGLQMKLSGDMEMRVKFVVPSVQKVRVDADGNPELDADGKPIIDTIKDSAEILLSDTQISDLLAGNNVEVDINIKAGDPTAGTEKITFKMEDGKLSIDAGDREIHVNGVPESGATSMTSSAIGLARLGLKDGMKGTKDVPLTTKVDPNAKFSIELALDGAKKTIEIDKNETKASLQEKLNFAFGKDTVTIDTGAAGEDLKSGFKLNVGKGRKLQVVGGTQAGMHALNVQNGQANTVGLGDTIGNVFGYGKDDVFNVKINGKAIELKGSDTISDMMSKISKSGADVKLEYDDYSNKFTMSRLSSGKGFELEFEDDPTNGILAQVFGGTKGQSIDDVVDTDGNATNDKIAQAISGQNAMLTINGQDTERASNNFTINGVNFELLRETKDASGNSIEESVTTTRDTEAIFSGIKSFVDDYNTLIKELNGLIDAKAEYKDYPPLTDAQRKDMSQSEIDAWEKKAQVGLLRGDSDISTFLSNMRIALFDKPVGAKYGLYDIGIDTSKDWEKRGALEINEATLKEMINNDPTAIQELFTYSKTKEVIGTDGTKQVVPDGVQGIANAFRNIIKQTANTSSGSPGTLVSIAGYANTGTDKKNSLYDKMQSATDRIKNLTTIYEKQKSRYWQQFNTMEKVLAQLSAQSSWLGQQTGGY